MLCFDDHFRSDSNQKDRSSGRRAVIMLRSPRILAQEAAVAISDYVATPDGSTSKLDGSNINNIIHAEELLLLSLHPCPVQKLSPIPSMKPREWAEPGWHIDLDVPKPGRRKTLSNCALQVEPPNSVMNRLYSEISSTQGHQMASLLDSHHLKVLSIERY